MIAYENDLVEFPMLPRSLVIAELDRTGMQYLGRIETMDLPEVRFISLTDNYIEELPSLRELTKLLVLLLVSMPPVVLGHGPTVGARQDADAEFCC